MVADPGGGWIWLWREMHLRASSCRRRLLVTGTSCPCRPAVRRGAAHPRTWPASVRPLQQFVLLVCPTSSCPQVQISASQSWSGQVAFRSAARSAGSVARLRRCRKSTSRGFQGCDRDLQQAVRLSNGLRSPVSHRPCCGSANR